MFLEMLSMSNALSGRELMNTEDVQDPHSTEHILSEVMLEDKLSAEDEDFLLHLQDLVLTNTCIQRECASVSGPQCCEDSTSKNGMSEDEKYRSGLVLLGLDNISGGPTNVQKCFAECHDYMAGFQRIMDKVCELWPVEPHVGLKSRFLAEILMDMSTVAVYWAQSVSSSAECERKVMDEPAGYERLADTPRKENFLHATPECSSEINPGLLVSMLVPQVKFLAQQYLRSLGSDVWQGLHEAKIIEFRGFGPDPAPNWIPDKIVQLLSKYDQIGSIHGILNPVFECMWLPWAQRAEFYHHLDVALVCNQEMLHTGLQLKRLASLCFSWAIPTRPVLEYMVSMAPHGKIAEIGSGLGYWAALLKKLGADVVAVDDFSEATSQGSLYFPETISMDGEEFVRQGGAIGRALFFCWPLKSHSQNLSLNNARIPMYQRCFVDACLKAFHGDTVFFVGERDDGCTFDIAAWMQGSSKHRKTWLLEREMEIPTWPGVHDVFLCFVKHKDTGASLAGKKKRRIARKAQLVEDSLFFLSKEEDFLKASTAAYPECTMQ
ncbi:hypothetical protein L7F22_054130 [Adiantum nelumboides]|nr:hypothetical protein [Adiantum nelumboides]